MTRTFLCCVLLLLLASTAHAEEPAKEGDKLVSGMSIVGDDEAPKSLAIVPWKASELGDALEVAGALDGGPQPIDRDVFLRELDYYEIRVGSGDVAPPPPANLDQ